MKIAIIGAGFTGLAAGLKLSKAGHKVTIFEKENAPGGLAIGFQKSKWEWPLEKHYHHWFTSDKSVLSLARKMGYRVLIKRPKTSVYVENKIYQLDSPLNVLLFPRLTILERIRMGLALGFLKFNPFWQPFEKYKISSFLPKLMGKSPYKKLWQPLLLKKFGPFAKDISLAWFWARIVKRTPSLAYPQGGFLKFANAVVLAIQKAGGKVVFKAQIKKICVQENRKINVDNLIFDKAIVTLPTSSLIRIMPQLPNSYKRKLSSLKGISAINLVLRLRKPLLREGTYWLNVSDEKYPLMGIVEHTNFMDKKYYNDEHLVYLGNYLEPSHRFMKMRKDELLEIFDPILSKINKNYRSTIIDTQLFTDSFAQPIYTTNYSELKPPFRTPLKNIYLANIQQVHPWDRGTNYAIELGEKVADTILED